MHIDARELEISELLKKIKEILSAQRCGEVDVELQVNTVADAKKVEAFVSMSGCSAGIDKKDNYYIIHVKGNPCCT